MFTLPLRQNQRHIIHIDADAFFASVEQVLNPTLRDKAILVGSSETHGIVSAASYEAKRFGIKSGMAMFLARRKCPHALVVPAHFSAYREFSQRMYQIFTEYTDDVEMSSIDEAFLDITGLGKLHKGTPAFVAKKILMQVNKKLGISVSCGLASNKTVAKVASSSNKPHKLTVVPFGKERKFLAPLPLRSMPGIGPKTHQLFQKFGFEKLGDLSSMSSEEVIHKFGVSVIPLWKRARGVDNRPVISTVSLPKSISKERTFYQSEVSNALHLKTLRELMQIVLVKLRSYDMKGKTVFLKIKYHGSGEEERKFKSVSFRKDLGMATSLDSTLLPGVKALFLKNVRKNEPIRLVGVGMAGLAKNYNLSLFAVDKLKNMYGKEEVNYGA